MIETEFFILTPEQYQEHSQDAKSLGISIDYYLDEFTDIEGPNVVCVDGEWVAIDD